MRATDELWPRQDRAPDMNENSWNICWAEQHHGEALIPLLRALHEHDVADSAAVDDVELAAHVERLLNPSNPHRLVLVLDDHEQAIGLAAVATFISISELRQDRCKQMELKELFVAPDHRGSGIGEALMAWVENEANINGASRLDWHVKRDNHRGIAFYRRFGATVVEDRLSMRKLITPRQEE